MEGEYCKSMQVVPLNIQETRMLKSGSKILKYRQKLIKILNY